MKNLYLLVALTWLSPKVFAQVRFSASTDSSVYHYGDSMHVTITASNPGNMPDTLVFPTTLQVEYSIDSVDVYPPSSFIVTEVVIPPRDSIKWDRPYLRPYPVSGDTLTPGKHAVIAQVVRHWTSDTMWVTVDSGAAMVYHVSTDSSVYHYGDSIHVTVSAVNIGSEPFTLQLTSCDVGYIVDSSNLVVHLPCSLVIVPTVVSPGDSVEWSYLPPHPVTRDTLEVGKHSIVGLVNGYGLSDTLWVSVATLSAIKIAPSAPQGYVLENAYPDPFNPSTTIDYQLPARNHVVLNIYDALGRKVETLVDEVQNAGFHSITFDADRLASGVYFDKLEAGPFIETRKVLLLK